MHSIGKWHVRQSDSGLGCIIGTNTWSLYKVAGKEYQFLSVQNNISNSMGLQQYWFLVHSC